MIVNREDIEALCNFGRNIDPAQYSYLLDFIVRSKLTHVLDSEDLAEALVNAFEDIGEVPAKYSATAEYSAGAIVRDVAAPYGMVRDTKYYQALVNVTGVTPPAAQWQALGLIGFGYNLVKPWLVYTFAYDFALQNGVFNTSAGLVSKDAQFEIPVDAQTRGTYANRYAAMAAPYKARISAYLQQVGYNIDGVQYTRLQAGCGPKTESQEPFGIWMS